MSPHDSVITSGMTFVTCPRCFAMVYDVNIPKHENWHGELDQLARKKENHD